MTIGEVMNFLRYNFEKVTTEFILISIAVIEPSMFVHGKQFLQEKIIEFCLYHLWQFQFQIEITKIRHTGETH